MRASEIASNFVREALRCAFVCAACGLAAHAAPLATTVDVGNVGMYTSLRLNGGKPVVSYYDAGSRRLKLATCTAGCGGAAPTWLLTTVDASANVGWYTSLQLNAGNPVVSYYDVTHGALKLATCTAGCATNAPTWIVTTVDGSNADTGRFPSLQLEGGKPVISYRDRVNGDLKLATCTAACATATPTWVIVSVDTAGDVGRFTSMQLDAGRPVIAYFDFTRGAMKVATCVDRCATADPAWVFSAFDTVPGDEERQISLQLNGSKPVVSYYDADRGDLKLATCTAGCATAAPTWVVTTVDAGGNAGAYSSLQLDGTRPVVAYIGAISTCTRGLTVMSCHTAADLRLATCTADCASATPRWVIKTLDNTGLAGWDPSLQLDGGKALASYHDFLNRTLKLAVEDLAEAAVPSNYTGLWWNFDEAGWGINFNHQGDTVFATLFSYDGAGNPAWWVMPAGARLSDATFSGTLYRTTASPFNANPFVPIGAANVTAVGAMTVSFSGDSASLEYTVDGVAVGKTIRKQVFGARAATCRSTTADRASLANYQDLWWNAAESGWGMNLTQQGDIVFAAIFTYDSRGLPLWLVAPAATRQADGSFEGALYMTHGPAFDATPFTPIPPDNVTPVGTLQLRFTDGAHGTLAYSVNGVGVVKAITRQVFSSPVPACAS